MNSSLLLHVFYVNQIKIRLLIPVFRNDSVLLHHCETPDSNPVPQLTLFNRQPPACLRL